jgi:DinB superfamily
MNTDSSIPDRTEAAEYYFQYINQVGPGDIRAILRAQQAETVSLLESIDDSQSLYRYEPGKWSIREVVSHVSDTERVFVFRALWFARGFDGPLPSFDQNIAVPSANADKRAWREIIEEFRAVRGATIAFFDSLPADAWARRGIASGNEVTVRALAYIAAGHLTHHTAVLRKRYLNR